MGWFDEQIKLRQKKDDEIFEDSFIRMADSVLGSNFSAAFANERELTKDAVDEILTYYNVTSREVPEKLEKMDEILEYLLQPSGIMIREVELKKRWHKDAFGPMLTTFKDSGKAVALMPSPVYGYTYLDPVSGTRKNINTKAEELFNSRAYAFYKPFPMKKLKVTSLLLYVWENIEKSNFIWYLIFTGIVTLVGMLLPYFNDRIFSDVIRSKSIGVLLAISVFMVFSSISRLLFDKVKEMFLNKISVKVDLSVQAATMMRILSLPPAFFRDYSAGELSNRAGYIGNLVDILLNTLVSTGITSLFSLVYVGQIFFYAPALVVPALTVTIITVVLSITTSFYQMRITREQMEYEAKESGIAYAFVSGVQKIRLAGAEKRAFAKWGRIYAEEAKRLYNPPLFLKINPVLNTAISLIGIVVMYYFAVASRVSVSQYFAFNEAYSLVSVAFTSLGSIAFSVSQIKPTLDMARPIMEAEPEVSENKRVVEQLSGGVELNNITFRYKEDSPDVLNNLSLKINPGQYLAIVGKTGCGKSTLMRIILGFEHPRKGAVYFDGIDLKELDVKSLRSRIGSVMQNGKLMQGDIYSNIVISAPSLTVNDAWEAAELAGIAEDIRQMPMGMGTIISEGQGGISGGQKQRLMIARAIAPKPKILIFDEATSALDNITQKQISDALDSLKCTRIVIAHRLSTIKNCDRIVVLNEGRIAEDGTYDELLQKGGIFAELVARQQVERGE